MFSSFTLSKSSSDMESGVQFTNAFGRGFFLAFPKFG